MQCWGLLGFHPGWQPRLPPCLGFVPRGALARLPREASALIDGAWLALLLTLLPKVQFNRAQVMCDLRLCQKGLSTAFEFTESLFKNTASALSPLTNAVEMPALIDTSSFVLCLDLN